MIWSVLFHEAFEPEFDALPEAVQDELLAHARLLEKVGPTLGRPRVDTLKGSRHANMKELRFNAEGGAFGAWPLPSIRGVKRSFWYAGINQVTAAGVITANSSARRMLGSTTILRCLRSGRGDSHGNAPEG